MPTKVNGVSLFTQNTKTACPSWAISTKSCAGACGTICKSCYAKHGRFSFPAVQNAMEKRREWFNNTCDKEVINTIVDEIKKTKCKYFRAFVAGDFEDLRSIRIWKEIAQRLPMVKFWFPTKTYLIKEYYRELAKLNKLANVSVRPSGINFDEAAKEVNGLNAGTTAYKKTLPKGHYNCPGDCSKCRMCWTGKRKVAYHYH